MQFAEGVVLGTDSRSTTGLYITNRVTDKLTPICDCVFCCHSGSAADTQAVADGVTYQLRFHSIELNEPLLVYTAASLFKEMCYWYQEDLMAEIITAGWNPQEGEQVYSVPMGSMIVQQSFATGGSRCSCFFGCVSATYREGMTEEECLPAVHCQCFHFGHGAGWFQWRGYLPGSHWGIRGRVAGTSGRPESQIHQCHFTTSLNPEILRYNKRHPILLQNSINSLSVRKKKKELKIHSRWYWFQAFCWVLWRAKRWIRSWCVLWRGT